MRPYVDLLVPNYVVSRYTVSDGLGGEHGASYEYAGAKTHLKGGGWLGFREIAISDERSGGKVVTTHNQDFEAGTHGTTARSQNYMNGVLTSQTENFYSARAFLTGPYAGKQRFIQLDGTLSRKYELNGAELSCAQANTTYDDFGSATTVISKVEATCGSTSAFTQTTTGAYNHDTVNWRLGQLTRSQTTSEAPGTTPVTRTVAYTYSPTTGLVTSDTIEPDSATLRVTNSYSYDVFGNQTRIEVSGPDFPTRATTGVSDSRGRYTLTTTNALGHSETKVFDPKWGLATSVTGPNDLTTTLDYDGLGRLISTTSPDGKIETTAMALCDGSDPDCPALARTRLTRTATSGSLTLPPSTVYVDLLGRTLRTKAQAFDGRIVFQDSEYDNLARLARSSLPYYRGNIPSQWTSNVYDAAGRVTEVTGPDGSRTTTSYNGFTTCVANALNQALNKKSCVTANAAGQVVETTDALIGKTKYFYDAAGNVIKVIDAKNNTVLTANYDIKGRKTSMVDVDSGSRTYVYNAFGELLSETDAKNQTTGVTYDLLGRIKTRTGLEGTYTWAYDTAALGTSGQQAKGRLATVSGPNYARTPAYDNFGRELSVTTTINGTSYSVATNYDAHGRPDVVTYPTGFKTKNVYDAANHTVEVRDGTTSALYWQAGANAYNEHGQLLSYSLGNGLTTELGYDPVTHALKTARTGAGGVVQNLEYGFDVLGNLTSRRDNNQGYTETFGYDALNRLTQVSGPSLKTYTYDAIGNIETKSDVGAYTYHPTKVHAVTSTAGSLNATYAYDANGNMISGANRTLDYTSFNKPKTITANGLTTTFTYGPTFERLTKTNAQGETVYLGKLYERVTQGTAVTHKHYVSSPAGLVAVVSQGATSNVRYLHGDHLGSTHAITAETGAVVERLSFDPHGKRRQPNGQDATQPIASSVNRGYTGHEMDDESGLVNMNAREYDPVLGRFMQADTVIDGGMSQGFNRYSYVGNNPLTAVDPSGNRAVWKTNIDHWKKAAPYLPAVMHLFGPQLTNLHYYTVFKPMQDAYLVEHPEAQPWVKAIGSAVLEYFGMGYLAPAINSVFDFRMCTGAGGPEDKCRIAAQKSLVSGYAMYAVSSGFSQYFNAGSSVSSGYSAAGFAQHMGQALVKTAISEIATHNDVNPLVVNVVLYTVSWGGTKILGTSEDGVSSDRWDGYRTITGFCTRGPFECSSFLFDVADVLLEYQGLPSASLVSLADRIKAGEIPSDWLKGHSLGAITVNNLVASGNLQSGSVYALPFLNIGGYNVKVTIGNWDLVNGGVLGGIFNPGATMVEGIGMIRHGQLYYRM